MFKAGFSIVELMVVITIVGILVGVAAPAYKAYVARSRIHSLMPLAADLVQQTSIFGDQKATMPQGPQDVSYTDATPLGHMFSGPDGGLYSRCVAVDQNIQPYIDAICVQDVSNVYSWALAARIDIIMNVAKLGIPVNSVTTGSGKSGTTTYYNDISLSYYVYQDPEKGRFSNICFFGHVDPTKFGGAIGAYDSDYYDDYLPDGCVPGGEPV